VSPLSPPRSLRPSESGSARSPWLEGHCVVSPLSRPLQGIESVFVTTARSPGTFDTLIRSPE